MFTSWNLMTTTALIAVASVILIQVVEAQQTNPVVIFNTRTYQGRDAGQQQEVFWDATYAEFNGEMSTTIQDFPQSPGQYRIHFFDMGIPGYNTDVTMQYFRQPKVDLDADLDIEDTDGTENLEEEYIYDRYYIDLASGEPKQIDVFSTLFAEALIPVLNVTTVAPGIVIDIPNPFNKTNPIAMSNNISLPYTFQFGGIIIEIPTDTDEFKSFAKNDFASFEAYFGYSDGALDGSVPAATVFTTTTTTNFEGEETLQNATTASFGRGNVFLYLDQYPSPGNRMVINDFPNWYNGNILFSSMLKNPNEADTTTAAEPSLQRFYIELPEGEPSTVSVHDDTSGSSTPAFVSVQTIPPGTILDVPTPNPEALQDNLKIPYNFTKGGILVEFDLAATAAAIAASKDSSSSSSYADLLRTFTWVYYSYDSNLAVGCPSLCADGDDSTKMQFGSNPIPESLQGLPFINNCDSVDILLSVTPNAKCAQMKSDFNQLPIDLQTYCGCPGKTPPNVCEPVCETTSADDKSIGGIQIHDGPFAPLTCAQADLLIVSSTDTQTCNGFKLAASGTCCNPAGNSDETDGNIGDTEETSISSALKFDETLSLWVIVSAVYLLILS